MDCEAGGTTSREGIARRPSWLTKRCSNEQLLAVVTTLNAKCQKISLLESELHYKRSTHVTRMIILFANCLFIEIEPP